MTDGMSKSESIEMMKRCSNEIKDLRAQIARLEPKADAYDNLVTVLGLLPKTSRGFGEDLAWRLDKRIEELLQQPAAGVTDGSVGGG